MNFQVFPAKLNIKLRLRRKFATVSSTRMLQFCVSIWYAMQLICDLWLRFVRLSVSKSTGWPTKKFRRFSTSWGRKNVPECLDFWYLESRYPNLKFELLLFKFDYLAPYLWAFKVKIHFSESVKTHKKSLTNWLI